MLLWLAVAGLALGLVGELKPFGTSNQDSRVSTIWRISSTPNGGMRRVEHVEVSDPLNYVQEFLFRLHRNKFIPRKLAVEAHHHVGVWHKKGVARILLHLVEPAVYIWQIALLQCMHVSPDQSISRHVEGGRFTAVGYSDICAGEWFESRIDR